MRELYVIVLHGQYTSSINFATSDVSVSGYLFFDILQLLLQLLHIGRGSGWRGGRGGRGWRRARAVVHVVRRRRLRGRLPFVHLHLRQVAAALLLNWTFNNTLVLYFRVLSTNERFGMQDIKETRTNLQSIL